ncbi:DctM TRAP-type C4-dicarboxylate transport system, small permease component [Rhabdaerophilaceae bacterium]
MMLATLEKRFFQFLEALLVILLAGMVLMVFGNVILRWFADSGIQVSEELSRYFFVWLTFIGAVVVARENAHLGVDALVRMLGPGGRLFCMIASDSLVLLCCIIFFWGTWKQAPINYTIAAPVTGINMLWVFGVGFFTSVGIGAMVLMRLLRALTGRLRHGELDQFSGLVSDSEIAHSLKGRLE